MFCSFSCDRCNFTGSESVTSQGYSYLASFDDNIYISINNKIGWCNKCANLVAVEILPSAERLQDMEKEIDTEKKAIADEKRMIAKSEEDIRAARRNYNSIKDREMQDRQWFIKLVSSYQASPDLKKSDFVITAQEKDLKDKEYKLYDRERNLKKKTLLVSGLSSRVSKPRCLSCGSEDSFPLELPHGVYSNNGTRVSTGITHPNCGGNFLVDVGDSSSKINLLLFNDRLYDFEGIFICTESKKRGIDDALLRFRI